MNLEETRLLFHPGVAIISGALNMNFTHFTALHFHLEMSIKILGVLPLKASVQHGIFVETLFWSQKLFLFITGFHLYAKSLWYVYTTL